MVKRIFPILFFICSCSRQSDQTKETKSGLRKKTDIFKHIIISDSTNTLTGKIETLELVYIDWFCACANWITIEDKKKYEDSGLAMHAIFIEPANPSLNLPESFNHLQNRIKATGQFYVREDYPQGTVQMEEPLEKAKVFRYTSIQIIKIH